jgi:hypothetical protein
MKKLTLTLLSLLVVGAIYFTSCKKTNEELVKEGEKTALSSSTPLYLGFRDASGNAVLDINDSIIESFFSTQAMSQGANSITFEPIIINDNPNVSGYFASLPINFVINYTNEEGETDDYYINMVYPIYYDSIENKYFAYDLDYLPSEINGGKLFCKAINCVGCQPQRNATGELTGCSECYPIGLKPGQNYKCTVKGTFSISIGTINIGLNLGK